MPYHLPHSPLEAALHAALGPRRAARLVEAVEIPVSLRARQGLHLERADLAMALSLLLFDDLLRRVPLALAYVQEARAEGRRLVFDHGALRTVAAPCGGLPAGSAAFHRILEPLGYAVNGLYPLDRLQMTGRAYAHADLPEQIPQYFVSELHPERFSTPFQDAVARIVESSVDPLSSWAVEQLERLRGEGELDLGTSLRLLPELVACFDRQHAEPSLADYQRLRLESHEMAWIATEGNAFNHATDRVEDVRAVAEAQRAKGRPIKDEIEVSRSGRVLQTAFRAAVVPRLFRDARGDLVPHSVPGSFHEFITRREDASGRLDLAFDAGNAQSIFGMTTSES